MPASDSILLVDDEPELLIVLKTWFEGRAFEVDVASDPIDALAHLHRRRYDVMITDLRMPGLNGLQLQAVAKELQPELNVIFLSGQAAMDDAIEALREHGAFDFLTKPLANVHRLQLVVEKALCRRADGATTPARQPAAPPVGATAPDGQALAEARVEPLTTRELEIMTCLAQGLSNRAIADRLALSPKTVKNYLSRVYDKLGAANRTQAVLFCQRHRLV